MAREIKYFSGLATGTLYTVPAGRTAKVIFNYIEIGSGGYVVSVGGAPAFSSTISDVFKLGVPILADSTATSSLAPGNNQTLAVQGINPIIVTNIWFLGPGAGINAGVSVSHSFLVIEEY